jgi:hypothetical protein
MGCLFSVVNETIYQMESTNQNLRVSIIAAGCSVLRQSPNRAQKNECKLNSVLSISANYDINAQEPSGPSSGRELMMSFLTPQA